MATMTTTATSALPLPAIAVEHLPVTLSLLMDHGDDNYDYYERLAIAVEHLPVAVGRASASDLASCRLCV